MDATSCVVPASLNVLDELQFEQADWLSGSLELTLVSNGWRMTLVLTDKKNQLPIRADVMPILPLGPELLHGAQVTLIPIEKGLLAIFFNRQIFRALFPKELLTWVNPNSTENVAPKYIC